MPEPKKPATKKPAAKKVERPDYLTRRKDKVAIVGFAHSKSEAPFEDPDYEIWGINRLHTALPDKQWDRYFQIHDIAAAHEGDEEHLNWLRSLRVPVYVRVCPSGRHRQIRYPV
jgi:hypothetical protein